MVIYDYYTLIFPDIKTEIYEQDNYHNRNVRHVIAASVFTLNTHILANHTIVWIFAIEHLGNVFKHIWTNNRNELKKNLEIIIFFKIWLLSSSVNSWTIILNIYGDFGTQCTTYNK